MLMTKAHVVGNSNTLGCNGVPNESLLVVLQTTAYNQVADERSWQALRFYLLDLFGYTSMSNPYTNTTVPDTASSFA